VTGVVLLAFFAYLYLPHVTFKAAAELYVDLGRKQNASQLEEIASAVIPSAILHLLTLIALSVAGVLTPISLPGVNWPLIAAAFSANAPQQFTAVLGTRAMHWTLGYAGTLVGISILNGALYGKSRYLKVILSADPRMHPEAAAKAKRVGRSAYVIFTLTFFWDYVYGEYYVAIHRWSILSPHVFVKTKEGQLLHGRFVRYDRTRNGEVEAITLVQVSRYTREKMYEVLQRGVNPISRLEGEIYIKWSEVVDINVTTPAKLTQLWRQYEHERKKRAEQRGE
jgi:hypothetical protein